MSDEASTIYAVERSSINSSPKIVGVFTNQSAATKFAKKSCHNHQTTEATHQFEPSDENHVAGYHNETYNWCVIEHIVFDTIEAHEIGETVGDTRSKQECPFCGGTNTYEVGEPPHADSNTVPDTATGDLFMLRTCDDCYRDYWNSYTLSGYELKSNETDESDEAR